MVKSFVGDRRRWRRRRRRRSCARTPALPRRATRSPAPPRAPPPAPAPTRRLSAGRPLIGVAVAPAPATAGLAGWGPEGHAPPLLARLHGPVGARPARRLDPRKVGPGAPQEKVGRRGVAAGRGRWGRTVARWPTPAEDRRGLFQEVLLVHVRAGDGPVHTHQVRAAAATDVVSTGGTRPKGRTVRGAEERDIGQDRGRVGEATKRRSCTKPEGVRDRAGGVGNVGGC